ncbi:MAG: hypothetical protein GEU75_10595 [Dehalococcoidia bacterium]|nr:hypothetical protein [Dehalococcoidia bacterium]
MRLAGIASTISVFVLLLGFLILADRLGPTTERQFAYIPSLPPEEERAPRADEVTSSGICKVTSSVTKGVEVYSRPALMLGEQTAPPRSRQAIPPRNIRLPKVDIVALLECPMFLETTVCSPSSVYPIRGVEQVCDAGGLLVRTQADVLVNDQASCAIGRPAIHLEDGIGAGLECSYVDQSLASGEKLDIQICYSVRFQDSCSRFAYTVP